MIDKITTRAELFLHIDELRNIIESQDRVIAGLRWEIKVTNDHMSDLLQSMRDTPSMSFKY